ncbi:MAG: hypothetical protein NW226_19495 [Microscillaceae bacterium]|nr:hypothetical protein [Microscillaceae bacterium]
MEENKIRQLVERIGIVCDKEGYPPLAGRLLGCLMLAEPPYKTFDEIVEFLHASKSAVSNTIKFLESQHMVDYITFSGDRRRYFRLKVETWPQVVQASVENLGEMKEKFKEALQIRSNQYPEFNEGLKDVVLLYEIILDIFPQVLERWDELRKKKTL